MSPGIEESNRARPPAVLIVESDELVLEELVLAFRHDRFEVCVARDSEEALDLFHVVGPDVIVLDSSLPGMSGMDLCRLLRNRSTVPIVIVERDAKASDPVRGFDVGADDYIARPHRTRELVARTRAVLRRSSPDVHPDPTRL